MLEIVKKYKVVIIIVLLVFVLAVLGLMLLNPEQQRVNVSSNAPKIQMDISPPESDLSVGEKLIVDVNINAGEQNITAADITLKYDANLLAPDSSALTPNSAFTTIINDQKTKGKIHYVGVNPTANIINGDFKLGTLSFSVIGEGNAVIEFEDIHINASGVPRQLRIDGEIFGTYKIER
jgi:hypothetical protein